MKKAHQEAAKRLYEGRNPDSSSSNGILVDLYRLHPKEAVEFMEHFLTIQQKSSRPVYATIGSVHLSKNGKGQGRQEWENLVGRVQVCVSGI